MRGPLVGGGGMLSGGIDIGRTEISVAEGLGANAQARAGTGDPRPTPAGGAGDAERAQIGDAARRAAERPARGDRRSTCASARRNQIFVRGRGLDVELGGAA